MNVQSRIGADVHVNGRRYRWPKAPTVVVCIDGSEPGYIERAIEQGLAPNLDRLMSDRRQPPGASPSSRASPTRTTSRSSPAAPPAVHGIAGNYFYDRDAGVEVMMNDVALHARADHPEGLPRRRRQGRRGDRQGQAAHAARQRPRHERPAAPSPSRRRRPTRRRSPRTASTTSLKRRRHAGAGGLLGRPLGIRLRRRRQAPRGAPPRPHVSVDHRLRAAQGRARLRHGQRFYAMIDRYVGELDALGCVLVLTADHGMNDKHLPNGEPDVIYLQELLDNGSGPARRGSSCRSPIPMSPITARSARSRPSTSPTGRRPPWRRGSPSVDGVEVAMTARRGLPALRAAGRPDRRRRRDLDQAQGARHQPRAGTTCPA